MKVAITPAPVRTKNKVYDLFYDSLFTRCESMKKASHKCILENLHLRTHTHTCLDTNEQHEHDYDFQRRKQFINPTNIIVYIYIYLYNYASLQKQINYSIILKSDSK